MRSDDPPWTEDDEERLVQRAREVILDRRRISRADLVAVLHDTGDFDTFDLGSEDSEWFVEELVLIEAGDDLWSTTDGTIVVVDDVLDGRVFTHRVTQEEIDAGALVATPDLVVVDLPDNGIGLRGGGRAEIEYAGLTASVGGAADALTDRGVDRRLGALVGTPGWLPDDLAPGDLLALRRADGLLSVERIEPGDLADGEVERDGLRPAVESYRADGEGVEPYPALLDLLATAPAAFTRPVAPVDELLATAGLERRGIFLGPADEPWELPGVRDREEGRTRRGEEFGFDRCCHEAYDLARAAYRDLVLGGGWDDDHDRRAVARALGHHSVADALLDDLAGPYGTPPPEMSGFLEALEGVTGAASAGVWHLRGLVALAHGDPVASEAHHRQALLADPDHVAAPSALVDHAVVRGQFDRALRLLRALPVADDAQIEWLEARRPPATAEVGRNDPCPCGSGRKFKQCCLRNPKPASGGDTVGNLLTHKLLSIDGARSPRATLIGLASSATLAPVDDDGDFEVDTLIAFAQDPFIADLALHESGLAEDFHARWAEALPDAERRVLADWIDAPRRLWEITDLDPGTSIELRDTATADRLTVTERLASTALEVGDLLLATVVPVGAELQLLGTPLPVPLQARESALELVDARATADEWAEWYGWLAAPPTMVTRDGHPLVICRAELRSPLDQDRVEATLDDRLGEPDGGRWHDTIDIEGETAIRSTIAVEPSAERVDGERVDGDRTEADAGCVLSVETISVERLDDAIAMLAEWVGPLEVVSRDEMPAEQAMRARGDESDGLPDGLLDPDDLPAEVAALLEDKIREMEIAWLDEPVPALGGLTPRAAAADPTRREDLEAILREGDSRGAPGGFDSDRLRRHLGL